MAEAGINMNYLKPLPKNNGTIWKCKINIYTNENLMNSLLYIIYTYVYYPE